jgi:hypothetical protein
VTCGGKYLLTHNHQKEIRIIYWEYAEFSVNQSLANLHKQGPLRLQMRIHPWKEYDSRYEFYGELIDLSLPMTQLEAAIWIALFICESHAKLFVADSKTAYRYHTFVSTPSLL